MARFNLSANIRKLIMALRCAGVDITYNTKQFKGREGKYITLYWLGKSVFDESRNRYDTVEIYRSVTMAKIIFYLRDMLFTVQGKELPNDVADWCKERIVARDKGDTLYADYEWEDNNG